MNNRQLSFTFVTAELFQKLGTKQTNKYYNKRCSYYSLTQKITRGFRSSVPGTRGKDQICISYYITIIMPAGFSGRFVVKNPPSDIGDLGSIPGSGRLPEEGNGNPVQYSCLGKPIDRGSWWAAVHGVTKSQTQLSKWEHTHNLWTNVPLLLLWVINSLLSSPVSMKIVTC